VRREDRVARLLLILVVTHLDACDGFVGMHAFLRLDRRGDGSAVDVTTAVGGRSAMTRRRRAAWTGGRP
jgi:hypothetical protein